jgi:hypothetical protein
MGEGSSRQIEERYETASAIRRQQSFCGTEGCEQHGVCSLELRYFCLGHFISYSYQRLELWNAFVCGDPSGTTTKSNDRFLQECLFGSQDLVSSIETIDNLSRARLFDIFLWASDVSAKRTAFRKAISAESGDGRPVPR